MLKICSKIFFFMFLAIAAWQDYQTREMDGWLLSAAAIAGIVVCIIGCFTHQRALCDIILSCGVGAGLLVLSRLTSGCNWKSNDMFTNNISRGINAKI